MKTLQIKTIFIFIFLGLLSCEKNRKPEINIIHPADNSYIGAWTDNEIQFNCTDKDGQIILIQLQLNDSIIYSVDSLINSYTLDATNLKTGQISLSIIATDNDNEKSKKEITLDLVESGYFQDERDTKNYRWIKIGKQTWMAENLAFLPKVYPSEVQIVDEQNPDSLYPLYYVYNYQGESVEEAKQTITFKEYGVLYNYTAITNVPNGWKLPSEEDWKELFDFCNYDVKSLKYQQGWKNNKNGTNSLGLSIKPGGGRYKVGFDNKSEYGKFWVLRKSQDESPKEIDFHFNSDSVFISETDEHKGYSIRCIKIE